MGVRVKRQILVEYKESKVEKRTTKRHLAIHICPLYNPTSYLCSQSLSHCLLKQKKKV